MSAPPDAPVPETPETPAPAEVPDKEPGNEPDKEPTVALVGARGHGASHLRAIADLHRAGLLRFAAACDVAELDAEATAPLPGDVPVFTDHRTMLDRVSPDVAVIATPPHTHLQLATDAVLAGSDVLLEKPPFATLADHDRFAGILRRTGRACQVGFQHLGSRALDELIQSARGGRLGTVHTIAATGAWVRDDAYYARSSWAGRRRLDGQPVPDGALTNPFAHAVMNCLAVATRLTGERYPRRLEIDLYRARDIEVDDTSCLRAILPGGLRFLVAVTLCAERAEPPRLTVCGSAGRAVLEYTRDLLWLPGEDRPAETVGRVGLLADLLAHRAGPASRPLLVPLDRVRPFTAIAEAVHSTPRPHPIDRSHLRIHHHGSSRQVVVAGVNAVIERAGARLALFGEVGAPWAARGGPVVRQLDTAAAGRPGTEGEQRDDPYGKDDASCAS